MPVLKVLIADDEEIARKRLARLLQQLPDVEVCGEGQNAEEVLALVADRNPDVLLLDIQMPGLSGLDAMALLPNDGPYVVFCTAHAEHAVRAFDVGAIDYLLKPIEPERLKKALERARSREARKRSATQSSEPLDRLPIPTRQGIVLISPRDVTHAVLEGELVTIFTTSGRYLSDCSLQDLHERLPKDVFERVHRRALLNLEAVARLEPNEVGGFTAHTQAGEVVEVSRAAARELRKRLGLRRPVGDDADEG
jgi:two-component system LytT family response regulator